MRTELDAGHTLPTLAATAPLACDDATLPGLTGPEPRSGRAGLASRTFGRYLTLRKLGEGGMGQVWAAYDEELDRKLAVKVLHGGLAADPGGRARLQREARAMARLSHPNVVQVHDVGMVDGQVFVAMEFIRGQTLREWQSERSPELECERTHLVEIYIQAGRGLAAAHASGLVHRDFKPDNVMVDEDGRARVLDFGLVAPADAGLDTGVEPSSEAHACVAASSLGLALTRTGAMMGTPLYMAPEQFRGDRTDARTDQFNFCASLYQALYGTSPFEGDTMHTLMAAVLDGRLRAAPRASPVPSWLREVLVRGLATAPDDRFASMDELLAALTRDPLRRRTKRRRQVLALVAMMVASVMVVVAASRIVDHYRDHQRERSALDRLVALDTKLDEGGLDELDAERAFTTFIEQPENFGTRALGLAWLHRAERGQDEPNARASAYAQAYVLATDDATREAALLGLADHHRAQLRWDELARVLDRIDGHGSGERSTRLNFEAALARRDFALAHVHLSQAGAPTELAALVAELGRATPTPHRKLVHATAVDLDGDAVAELAFVDEGHELTVTAASPELSTLVHAATDQTRLAVVPDRLGAGPLVVSSDIRSDSPARLYSIEREGLVERFTWDEQVIISALSHDFDGDGHDEIYAGSGPYTRHLLELVDEGGRWSTRKVAPEIDELSSDIEALVAADLDGDGRDELLVAHGPWQAYQLRVLHYDRGRREFSTLDVVDLGHVPGLALARDRAGTIEVLALHEDSYEDGSTASPGIHGFRLRDGALEPTRVIAAPELGASASIRYGGVMTGDIDGDGNDELVVNTRTLTSAESSTSPSTSTWMTVIHDLRAEGSELPLTFAHSQAVGLHDLDGDGDDELMLRLVERDHEVWTLGTGTAGLPIRADTRPTKPSPALDDPVLARMWSRAEDLHSMGLTRDAADAFITISAQTGDARLDARALERAGELCEAVGDDGRAAELFERAARANPGAALAATLGAVHVDRRQGNIEAALAHIERDLARTPAHADALGPLREELLALRRTSHALGFAEDLDRWQIHDALAIRRDHANAALAIDTTGAGPLLSRPVRWEGGLLVLELELELEHGGWSSTLHFGLRDARGYGPVRVSVGVSGGSDSLYYGLGCSFGRGFPGEARIPIDEGLPGRVRLRVVLDPARAEQSCRVSKVGGEVLLYRRWPSSAEIEVTPDLQLQLWSTSERSSLSATVYKAWVAGVELDDGPRGVLERDAASFVAGDYARVLEPARTPAAPERRVWRVLALARVGQLAAAATELRELHADPPVWGQVEARIQGLLWVEPQLISALLAESLGPETRASFVAETWALRARVNPRDPLAAVVVHDAQVERAALGAEAVVLRSLVE